MMDAKNKIVVNLSSYKKEDKEYFTFIARMNGAKMELHKEEDIEITNFSSYRKELIKFFIEKKIILFMVENYIYSIPEDYENINSNSYFLYTGAKNAASNFYKMLEKVLIKYDYFHGVPAVEFNNLTLEMIYDNRDNTKFQELFDYIEFENKYPEFYI